MSSGTYVDFSRTNLKIENTICEIIDNSMDSCRRSNTKKIHIMFGKDSEVVEIQKEHPEEKNPKIIDFSNHFTISVFDDGIGFGDEKELHAAFEHIQSPDNTKSRKEDDTGKFHLGMKEATLNRYNHFSLITLIEDKFYSRSIQYPGDENSCVYDWDKDKLNQNPTDSIPAHVQTEIIQDYLINNKMKTCAHMSAVRKPATNNKKGDYHSIDDFIVHMKHFIGIAYHKDLVAGNFEMKIGKFGDVLKDIVPVDLFWEEANPVTIRDYPSKKTVTAEQKYICEEMYGYGTLVGDRMPTHVTINGRKETFHVTAYILPADDAKKCFKDVTINWGKSHVEQGTSLPHVSSSGHIFKAENLQGFTFVRNGRTIIIGNMHNAENYGFYNGIPLPTATSKARIRIKVEYETTSGSRLDTVFRILPNKNGYEEISDDVWAAINKILFNHIDGLTAKNFHPHNKIGPFYKPNDKSNHWKGDKIGIPKACDICKTVIHEKGKTCPRAPCKVCSEPMNKYSCSTSKCMKKCNICTKTGHLESKCPTKKCSECGEIATPPNCACYCVGCGKLNANCNCPDPTCEECGELEKDCTCPPVGAFNIPFETGEEDDNYGRQYSVDFWPGHKESTVKIIKDIMDLAKIDKEDL